MFGLLWLFVLLLLFVVVPLTAAREVNIRHGIIRDRDKFLEPLLRRLDSPQDKLRIQIKESELERSKDAAYASSQPEECASQNAAANVEQGPPGMLLGAGVCRTCRGIVSQTATVCPHCGESFPGRRFVCPICSSTQVSARRRGYSVSEGVAGAVVAGPLGLFAGKLNENLIALECQVCRNKWNSSGS